MKFIDLFAGLGGFHKALAELGHECVFASEKKEVLNHLYYENFGIRPNRDITKIPVEKIPKHDILCAGFPCQPFSKAGNRKGLKCEKNGSLFDKIVEILDHHKPTFFILENVRNLKGHDQGKTWNHIKYELEQNLNYSIDSKILSPHNIGIPQHRERFFIVGSKKGLDQFKWPEEAKSCISVHEYLDANPASSLKLEEEKQEVLKLWQDFLDNIPPEAKLPSWPIWSMEFDATYPFETITPYRTANKELENYKGSFGVSLKGMDRTQLFENLPSYARTEQDHFPSWKKHYIRSNRAFFQNYRDQLIPVMEKIKALETSSWQKFEWNIQGGERKVQNYIIQFRASGVRLKRTNYFPSLVTIGTQRPIIGWQCRYMSPQEGARIQSMEGIKLPENKGTCFSALGNAVNVEIVKNILNGLLPQQRNTELQLTIKKEVLID